MNGSVTESVPQKNLETTALGRATLQEIQLELIRRRRFNAFNGERVADVLLQHRHLWDAVMMDRVAVSNPGKLPALGMVKLRDLRREDWNVDTLYILTHGKEEALELIKAFRTKNLGGMADIHDDPEDLDTALAGAGEGSVVVSVWWD